MQLEIFAVYDRRVSAFMAPFLCRRIGEAVRQFQLGVEDKESMLGRYPSDFALYHLGSFLEETGVLEPKESPEFVVSGSEFDGVAGLEREIEDA